MKVVFTILSIGTLFLSSFNNIIFHSNYFKNETNDYYHSESDNSTSLYVIDKGHSFIMFKATRFGVSKVFGVFDEISGKMDCTEGCHAEITILAGSLNSNLEVRDKHLKGEKFLDVANYPKISAKLIKIEKQSESHIAYIDIELLGITKSYEVPVQFIKNQKDPTGRETIAITGNLVINRMDYKMKMSKAFKNGTPLIGNNVELDFSLLFER